MKRHIDEIRQNVPHVGCDNETALEMCAEIERLRAACQAVLDEFPAFDGKRIEKVKRICRAALAEPAI